MLVSQLLRTKEEERIGQKAMGSGTLRQQIGILTDGNGRKQREPRGNTLDTGKVR
jgi:undecaprenyl pyrophosphate synthase